MKKVATVSLIVACIISLLVGILHFFAPYAFGWYSYIPDAPVEIYQSVNYINFCFSFLLAGISLLLMLVRKRLFEGSSELMMFYFFFVLVWLSRIVIQLLWPSGLQVWLVTAFTVQFIFTLVPMFYLIRQGIMEANHTAA
ncbi:hypothetical protein [Youngiibacter multivorans]|uniref:Magnesium-transporting ATPase (P-type) n=1 Tax=Youngiibacter multivorans TaxID=937251 RepID=A0ABS4G3S3_9CLOT|nr:hypothetical protein [Youngiibacter multivorans]MBP1919186.1 magnesium-transporting ATPase (P-type) [Youngiibacter multivorans]